MCDGYKNLRGKWSDLIRSEVVSASTIVIRTVTGWGLTADPGCLHNTGGDLTSASSLNELRLGSPLTLLTLNVAAGLRHELLLESCRLLLAYETVPGTGSGRLGEGIGPTLGEPRLGGVLPVLGRLGPRHTTGGAAAPMGLALTERGIDGAELTIRREGGILVAKLTLAWNRRKVEVRHSYIEVRSRLFFLLGRVKKLVASDTGQTTNRTTGQQDPKKKLGSVRSDFGQTGRGRPKKKF